MEHVVGCSTCQPVLARQARERRGCRVLGQPRASRRYEKRQLGDEQILIKRIVSLSGHYGYRRVTALLHNEVWLVNQKRVERIGRQKVLKVLTKQPERSRVWLTDGSIVLLQLEFQKHVWGCDFMEDGTRDCRTFRILNIIDEFP